jgi:aminoglycoside/choline kinase family phosphotransferase
LANDSALTPAQAAFVRGQVPEFSEQTWSVSLAGQAASQRLFVRIKEKDTVARSFILVIWDSKDEDWPRFLAIPQEVAPHAPFLPKIFASDARHGLVLEEDLGGQTLHRCVSETAGHAEAVIAIYCRVLDALCVWQSLEAKTSAAVASRAMDAETFLWETDYFARRCVVDFCGPSGEQALGEAWEKERRRLALAAASLPRTFIHRDFQSENILLTGAGVRFVDFQGARLGPPGYDVASLLYDPYIGFLSAERTAQLFDYYCSCAVPVKIGRHDFDLCAAQRLMQACGAYGNLSIHKGKTQYREFMPVALDRLKNVMERLPEYPAMQKVVEYCWKTAGRSVYFY